MRIEEILQDLERRKRLYGIEEFKDFLNHLGNPQKHLKCVHVAGTNGKGSTSNYIHQVFSQKYRIGLFTSPYLIKHNDRIRINHEWISDDKIIEYYNNYNDLWLKYNLSSFEIDMFMAILYFNENNVDFCVFEVGLGGTYDATNVIDSFLSIITNISFDHQEYLGNTLESIASAKAGIIKPNSVFMTLDKQHASLYQEICHNLNTKCFILNELPNKIESDFIKYSYLEYDVELSTDSSYQLANSFLALNAILEIKKEYPISKEEILKGLKQAKWSGRFELICDKPKIIVDGAHNVAGIKALVETLKNYPKVKILFSALKDKEYQEMIRLLSQVTNEIYVTQFSFYRALEKEELKKLDSIYVESATKLIDENRDYDGLIVICGSLYFISSILKELKNE